MVINGNNVHKTLQKKLGQRGEFARKPGVAIVKGAQGADGGWFTNVGMRKSNHLGEKKRISRLGVGGERENHSRNEQKRCPRKESRNGTRECAGGIAHSGIQAIEVEQ